MKTKSFCRVCLTVLPLAAVALKAQPTSVGSTDNPAPTPVVVSTKDTPTVSPELQAMLAAQAVRADIATSVASGAVTPDEGLARLKAVASPTGLNLDADAEQGAAALDIGLRLHSVGKRTEAQAFFQQAESALTAAIVRIGSTDGKRSADYLGQRAFVRAQFLNEAAQARGDLDAAQQLKPNDTYLQSLRVQLSRDKAADFTTTSKN